jgi:hypothetical protein
MRELRLDELDLVAGGVTPAVTGNGLNTAFYAQGEPSPSDGKVWNGTNGIYPAAQNAGHVVGGGDLTADSVKS